ncbi:hypothetical protein SB751_29240, partial [Cupriavidus sp. SIMBA_020]
DRATSGDYRVSGRSTGELDPDELTELRREHFGFIFQRYHLLSDLTAQGNVEVPAVYAGKRREARLERAADLMEGEIQPLMGLLAREAGKTFANAIAEVREAVD